MTAMLCLLCLLWLPLSGLALTIESLAPTGVTVAAAWPGVEVTSIETNATLTLYFGTTDGVTNATNWAGTNSYGAVTTAGQYYAAASNLQPATCYYYRWYALDAATNAAWTSSTSNWWTRANAPTDTPALAAMAVMAETNGNLLAPTNFFGANAGAIQAAGVDATNFTALLAGHTNTPISTAHTGVLDLVQLPPEVLTNTPALEQVVAAGGIVVSNGVTIDAANARTNTLGGLKTILGMSVQQGYGSVATGLYSHCEGIDCIAGGAASHAEGVETWTIGDDAYGAHTEGAQTRAAAEFCHAAGFKAYATNAGAYVWQGTAGTPYSEDYYYSQGNGTYCLNPVGGCDGVFIGTTNLSALLMAASNATNLFGDVAWARISAAIASNYAPAGVYRYAARSTSGSEVYVTASATGITAVISGATCTFTIPTNTILLTASLRLPAGNGTTLTLAGLSGSSWSDRQSFSAQAVREDTGAQITTVTTKLDPSTFTQGQVMSLVDTVVSRVLLTFQ